MSTIDQLDISSAMRQLHCEKDRPFDICQDLAARCADLLEQGDDRAIQCLQFMSDTYEFTESATLRTAIENCFVYHLGTRILRSSEYEALVKILPENLHRVLTAQLIHSVI